jgi:hypothetical protein
VLHSNSPTPSADEKQKAAGKYMKKQKKHREKLRKNSKEK